MTKSKQDPAQTTAPEHINDEAILTAAGEPLPIDPATGEIIPEELTDAQRAELEAAGHKITEAYIKTQREKFEAARREFAKTRAEIEKGVSLSKEAQEAIAVLFDHIINDSAIFNKTAREEFEQLPASERIEYIVSLRDKFYADNPEYTAFMGFTIYKEPLQLLDFFKAVTPEHFRKAGIKDKTTEYNSRYEELQTRIKQAETAIKKQPIDINKLKTIWPVLRIRNIFTESELAALFYIQHPRTNKTLAELDIPGINIMPFGPYLYLLNDAVTHTAAGRSFAYDLTPSGKRKSDRNKTIEVRPTENGFELVQHKKGETTAVTILNKELIKSTSAMKLFVFLLVKANQQNYKPVITFSLNELVSIGMYSNIQNARAGVKNHLLSVQSLQTAGERKKGRKYNSSGSVLFYNFDIDNNLVKVSVNENVDIAEIAAYYTILPTWALSLSNNAFILLLYIVMRSRTERRDKLNISLSIIRERLALPTKEEYIIKGAKWKPGQYVKQPIIEAIDGIKTAIEQNKDTNIKLEEHYIINDKTLEEWLAGFINVELSGDYSKQLKRIRAKQTKIIEANKKRREEAIAHEEAKQRTKNE